MACSVDNSGLGDEKDDELLLGSQYYNVSQSKGNTSVDGSFPMTLFTRGENPSALPSK